MRAPRALGWDEGWEATFAATGVAGIPARVTAQHRNRWTVEAAEGARQARHLGSDRAGPCPVTGDWVVCTPGPFESDPWGIAEVLPRRTAVRRGSAGGAQAEQVLAANVDRLWIVQALDRPPNPRSVERYLAIAWESGASPEIVLTKSDLAERLEESVEAVRGIALGLPVRVVSVEDGPALTALRDSLVPGWTIALLGPSGAGKSTLVNRLSGADHARTGEVRSGDRKGRHTTTARELFPIPGGSLLLDTPGMRELRVGDLDEGLARTFPEIEDLAARCRFRDCSHASEPGCAVLAAVEEGRLAPDRLDGFRKLEAEAAYERRRADPRAEAERVAKHRTALRTLRYHPKYRRGGDGES